MAENNNVLLILGRIEGKLDAEIKLAQEHRSDDVRRFTDVYGRLDTQDKEINQAKGAKGAILWLVGGGAAAIASLVVAASKAF